MDGARVVLKILKIMQGGKTSSGKDLYNEGSNSDSFEKSVWKESAQTSWRQQERKSLI